LSLDVRPSKGDVYERFSSLAFLFVTHFDVFGQERADAPVFKDGDVWRYRVVEHGEYMKTEKELNGIYELIYSAGRFGVFKLEESQKKELKSGTGVLVGLLGQTENQQHLQFPLYQGKSWSKDYTFRPRRRDADRVVNSVTRITDFGSITIGLGSFPAFKIERDAQFKHIDHWAFVYYWSPQTRSVVKYYMEVLKGAAAGSKREIELIKFGSAR
jgi:hypothetical protein